MRALLVRAVGALADNAEARGQETWAARLHKRALRMHRRRLAAARREYGKRQSHPRVASCLDDVAHSLQQLVRCVVHA